MVSENCQKWKRHGQSRTEPRTLAATRARRSKTSP